MNTKPLYCTQCKKTYNVTIENLKLMKEHDQSFNEKEYKKGCFFKDLKIKILIHRYLNKKFRSIFTISYIEFSI